MRFVDLTGQRFGRLTVLSRAEDYVIPSGQHKTMWRCKCDCGNEVNVCSANLRGKHTQSCGCLQREKASSCNHKYKTNYYDWESAEYLIGYTANGERFILDKDDYELIKDYCWYISDQGYVMTRSRDGYSNHIRMHRLLFKNCDDLVIDHINHDTKDNRRSNLRVVTRCQNQMNLKIRTDNSSGVTGVCFDKSKQKWYARIIVNKKTIFLGRYDTLDKAVKARKEAEEKYFGEYSYNNSINKNKEESA